MADDWRLTIDLGEGAGPLDLGRRMRERALESDARERLGERVAVSQDGPRILLYADSEAAARSAEEAVRPLLAEHDLAGSTSLARWHPVEERWEDASVPLPATEEEVRAEHDRRQADEEAESAADGYPEWEVRVALASHSDARALAERLEGEGIPLVRRWRYLLVGARTEDEARALAERLRTEAPAGAELEVELNGQEVWRLMPQGRFAVFGGIGV